MRKLLFILFLIILISLQGCSINGKKNVSESITEEEKNIVWDQAETVSLEDVMRQATDNHVAKQTAEIDQETFAQYYKNDQSDRSVLTQNEIRLLKYTDQQPFDSVVSTEAAIADIELYFRTLKYGYGAYYYFGGDEAFSRIEEKAVEQVISYDNLTVKNFADILTDLLLEYPDDHRVIGENHWAYYPDVHTKYYYDTNHCFSLDNKGYYKKSGEEKYYFDRFENSEGFIGLTLLEDGSLYYCPTLFVKADQYKENDKLILKTKNGEEIIEDVIWKENTPYSDKTILEPNAEFINQGDITYISIRNLDLGKKEEIERTFVSHAAEASNSKAIIFDIRSNGGGAEKFAKEWIEKYSGNSVSLNRVSANKQTLLNSNSYLGFVAEKTNANIIENSIPIFLLVDDYVGSSGEGTVKYLETMKNVMIIGSNTTGCQLCGNQIDLTLPNTGLPVKLGTSLIFSNELKSIENIGYLPDIWCDPKYSVNSVIQLLKNYGYLSEQEAKELKNAVDTVNMHVYLSPERDGKKIKTEPGSGFGSKVGQAMTVYLFGNDEKINDFEIISNNPELIVTKGIDGPGSIEFKTDLAGDYPISIIIGEKSYQFRYHAEESDNPSSNNIINMYLSQNRDGEGIKTEPGSGFGYKVGTSIIVYVFVDGERISDFDIVSDNPELEIKRAVNVPEDIEFTALSPGDFPISIIIGDETYDFQYHAE